MSCLRCSEMPRGRCQDEEREWNGGSFYSLLPSQCSVGVRDAKGTMPRRGTRVEWWKLLLITAKPVQCWCKRCQGDDAKTRNESGMVEAFTHYCQASAVLV
ncbi:uncharacterized protein LOC123511476 [Portunus trituberculatus]|uniref:uncharacterized protein LOC123511476 n=1 Tax=Portunus trituberculatus TaxID=210409 RepID=UPI001E1CB007|nr:uncharacterized protein LOC123511476 [Portunus trituberculatus]